MSDWFQRTIRRTPAPLPPNATRDGLLAEVLARPDDDEARWVAADWFLQHEPARGEFIAIQLTLAGIDASDPRHAELVERQDALLAKHKADWVGRFKGTRTEYGIEGERTWAKSNPTFWTFERGFVDVVKMAAADFVNNAEVLLTTEPVRLVQLTQTRAEMADFFSDCPQLERVRELDLGQNHLLDPDYDALFSTDRLDALEVLNLTQCRMGMRRGKRVFTDATARFPSLHTLLLWSTEIGDAGAAALAQCPFLETVKTLAIGYSKIGSKGLAALLDSPYLRNLEDLRLPGNRLDDADEALLVERFGPNAV